MRELVLGFCTIVNCVITDTRALASDLSLAVVRLTRLLRGRRANSQVTLTQLSALATLATEGAMTPGQLAARESVQPPSMTRVIASLVTAGLVGRAPHPTDGRQIIVTLSDSGKALIAHEAQVREQWVNEQLSRLDDDKIATLRAAVDIMGEILADSERKKSSAVPARSTARADLAREVLSTA